jgi:hypothetical protein
LPVERPARAGGCCKIIGQAKGQTLGTRPGDHGGIIGTQMNGRHDEPETMGGTRFSCRALQRRRRRPTRGCFRMDGKAENAGAQPVAHRSARRSKRRNIGHVLI